MQNVKELNMQEIQQINGGNWVKCGLGTLGGAALGGLSGAGKTIMLGPWALAGGAVGGIGGGMAGAAASCF
ncbi:Blp family class II bacteriocin [Vagococcus fluvialis]|uniref:Blp family class II bacteriocin n=1 Tax=Vagococcus fluvialis TaxID=2738 RepID=UPI00378F76BD